MDFWGCSTLYMINAMKNSQTVIFILLIFSCSRVPVYLGPRDYSLHSRGSFRVLTEDFDNDTLSIKINGVLIVENQVLKQNELGVATPIIHIRFDNSSLDLLIDDVVVKNFSFEEAQILVFQIIKNSCETPIVVDLKKGRYVFIENRLYREEINDDFIYYTKIIAVQYKKMPQF